MAIGRRTFVSGIGASLLWGALESRGLAQGAALKFSANPFTLGVASGEPEADGMVLWTRLAPQPLQGDGGMAPVPVPVRWEVAEDEGFKRVLAKGEAIAAPEMGHAVHVEVRGLKPAHPYWYRFDAGGVQSPVGRTRTAPARGAAVEGLKFCFASCQRYEAGYYAAYRHMVAEDPDLILFLGDYIYEANPSNGGVRRHQNPEPKDVAGYRVRYATYRGDPLLQAAHQTAPWAVIWDDHEVANDYANATDQDNGDPAAFLRRRAEAYRAYYEHMPLRPAARPNGPSMRIHRTLDWGSLAQFQLLDDRQYRGERACQPPELARDHKEYKNPVEECAMRHDPARSILGQAQEKWLLDTLGESKARWNFLAQQTLMAPLKRIDMAHLDQPPHLYGVDGWEGFPANRERIVSRWRDAKVSNPVALGGDIHCFTAAELVDVTDKKAPVVAAEFVGGAITSIGNEQYKKSAELNPNYKFMETAVRGYGRGVVSAGRSEVTFRGLNNSLDAESGVRDLAKFVVENGKPGSVAA